MQKTIWVGAWVIVAVLWLAGCGSAKRNGADLKNVFGVDERQEVTTGSYPWRAIGLVSTGCTGTLVSRDLVVTAAHCVIDPSTKTLRKGLGYFYPNHKNGSHKDQSWITHIWWGTTDPAAHRGLDWALLRLQQPLGDSYGWLGVHATTTSSFPDRLTVVGYSGDFHDGDTAGVDHNCHVRGRNESSGVILHDCDMTRGASGGPALRLLNNKLTIYGINVAEKRDQGDTSLHLEDYDSNHANIAIPSQGFLQQLKQLL